MGINEADFTEKTRRYRHLPRSADEVAAAVQNLIGRGYNALDVAHLLGLHIRVVEQLLAADGCAP
jgi:hypothetical protein